ncbi:actin-like protein Arp10 [Schizosaccharomyces octosporus yFS286]|uniref:Actin-like protein Arp10 n=1 Tax=Schizosaccharomyces octosporus (strain yFS286) TaxID=483514 RepID=S9PV20_SCHOY|nr:actin-like protein Arp10 [Schizosaccharomyces octosporus yFS286]EPX71363.1 actin-like protein Arp10 [Schizosaccharomyces octosporus yFS286]
MSTLLIQIDEKSIFLGIPEEERPRIRHMYNSNEVAENLAEQLMYSIIRLCSTLPNIVLQDTCVVLVVDLFLMKAILWMYSALTATLSAGSKDALVIDIGWYETKIIPIADLKVLSNLIHISNKSTISVIKYMHECLVAVCAASDPTNASRADLVPLSFQGLLSSLLNSSVYPYADLDIPFTMNAEETVRMFHNSPRNLMTLASKASHHTSQETHLLFDNCQNDRVKLQPWIPAACLDSLFHGTDSTHLDLVEQALPNLLQKVIQLLPMDLRRPLSKKILLIGPLASIPGMLERWNHEMIARGMPVHCLQSHYQNPFHAWYGATISCKSQMGDLNMHSSSTSAEYAKQKLPPSPMLYFNSQYSRGIPLPEWWFPQI